MKFFTLMLLLFFLCIKCTEKGDTQKRMRSQTVTESDSTILVKDQIFEGVIFKENYIWHLRNTNRQVPILEVLPVYYKKGWTPSIDNVLAFESTFLNYWEKARYDSLAFLNNKTVIPYKRIDNLKRQYVGFDDSTNTKYIWINLIGGSTLLSDWKKEPIIIEDGGAFKRSFIYDVKKDSITKVLIY